MGGDLLNLHREPMFLHEKHGDAAGVRDEMRAVIDQKTGGTTNSRQSLCRARIVGGIVAE